MIGPAPGERYLLRVGAPLDSVDGPLNRFRRLLLWSVAAGLIVAALIGRWMARSALAPLVRLAAATRTISVVDLHKRLPMRGAGDEIDEVVEAFNDTLARLEHAVNDMRWIADRHGASIAVASEPGAGTTMSVFFLISRN